MKKTFYIICFKTFAGTIIEKHDMCFSDFAQAKKIADTKNQSTYDINSFYFVKEITKEVNASCEREQQKG